MTVTNHHLAEVLGWTRVHYYNFIRFGELKDAGRGSRMYGWVQHNVPIERWASWNGDIWFKDPKDALLFNLTWA